MDGNQKDIVLRAFDRLRGFCDGYDPTKEAQRRIDLMHEIESRNKQVEALEVEREEALESARLLQHSHQALAVAFVQHAGILLEEIERLRPHGLTRKLQEALQYQRDVSHFSDILTRADLRFLSE